MSPPATLVPHRFRSLAFLAPLLALGPVTGPLLALSAVSFRNRRPVAGVVALAGVAAFWLGAPALLAAELRLMASHA